MTATLEPVTRSRPPGRTRSTPRHYRRSSLALCALLVLLLAVAEISATNGADSTKQLSLNTGPVLVSVQGVVASLAEADAAATAAILAGTTEDRDQRNRYVDALARSETELERVSALIGNDQEAHDLLQDIQTKVSRYAGLIEAARVETLNSFPGAQETLVDAANLLTEISHDAERLTSVSEQRFNQEAERRSSGFALTVLLFVILVIALVYAQVDVARRSRRLVNVPLVLATLLVIASFAWAVVVDQRAHADLNAARHDAYDSIAATAAIQAQGFTAKSSETLTLITGEVGSRRAADVAMKKLSSRTDDATADEGLAAQARSGAHLPDQGLVFDAVNAADSPRERATSAEMLVRWGRYRASVDELRRADKDAAKSIARGSLNAAFNGFNVSVESILRDNEAQYRVALEHASDRYLAANVAMLVGVLGAMVLVVTGYRLRIREYQ
jgi:hypothetical protein